MKYRVQVYVFGSQYWVKGYLCVDCRLRTDEGTVHRDIEFCQCPRQDDPLFRTAPFSQHSYAGNPPSP